MGKGCQVLPVNSGLKPAASFETAVAQAKNGNRRRTSPFED